MSLDQTVVYLNQRSYIEEIARAYGFKEGDKGKIPLAKEAASFEWVEGDADPTPEAVASAQKITGEIMWMAHKTRADVAYTSSLMASITLKAPFRCLEIGQRALKYLYATKEMKVTIADDGSDLTLYPDAAFAPSSGRSHTGWLVCWSGTPICWRSARQASVTLSTAESELQAIIDGSVGMLGLEAMLLDLEVEPRAKRIASDSTSGSGHRVRNWELENPASTFEGSLDSRDDREGRGDSKASARSTSTSRPSNKAVIRTEDSCSSTSMGNSRWGTDKVSLSELYIYHSNDQSLGGDGMLYDDVNS